MQEKLTVDILAQLIRMADPDHATGAGEIAEKILPWIHARLATSEPAPQPPNFDAWYDSEWAPKHRHGDLVYTIEAMKAAWAAALDKEQ